MHSEEFIDTVVVKMARALHLHPNVGGSLKDYARVLFARCSSPLHYPVLLARDRVTLSYRSAYKTTRRRSPGPG